MVGWRIWGEGMGLQMGVVEGIVGAAKIAGSVIERGEA